MTFLLDLALAGTGRWGTCLACGARYHVDSPLEGCPQCGSFALQRPVVADPARLLPPGPRVLRAIAWKIGRWAWSSWHVEGPHGALYCGSAVPSPVAGVSHRELGSGAPWPDGMCVNCQLALLRELEGAPHA